MGLRLAWPADYAAGDARGATGSTAFGSVDYQSRAAVAEYGMFVAAHGYVGGNYRDVRGVIRADDQEEIGDVAGHLAFVVMASGIEVRAGGFELWRVAFGDLMDVHGVFAGRKIFDVQLDAHAVGRGTQRGGADNFILRVADIDDNGFRGGVAVRVLRNGGNGEAR